MRTKNNAGSASANDDDEMDEAPILTEADVRDVEVFEGNTFVKRGRGRPPTGNAKELISVRLDRDVVAKLREAGPGWQSQVNTLLQSALGLSVEKVSADWSAAKKSSTPERISSELIEVLPGVSVAPLMQNVELQGTTATLSALAELARQGQTSVLTRHAQPEAIVVSFKEWEALYKALLFGKRLMAAPLEPGDVPERHGDLRDIDF